MVKELLCGVLLPAWPVTDEREGAGNWPVETPPTVFVAPVDIKFTPNCVDAVRSSSANFTRNRICFSAPVDVICRLLTMVLPNGVASAVARSATSLLVTVPVSDRDSRED